MVKKYPNFDLSILRGILIAYVNEIESSGTDQVNVAYHQPRTMHYNAMIYLINCAVQHMGDMLELAQDRNNREVCDVTEQNLRQVRFSIDDVGKENERNREPRYEEW